MSYRERRLALPGAVLWERVVGPEPEGQRILPDGCLDLVWDGRRLLVAGPDSTARWHESPAGTSYVGLRLGGGLGPALLGLSAAEVCDQSPDLDSLWPAGPARALLERVEVDPAAALAGWALDRAASSRVDPLGGRVLAMAEAGTPVATIADRLAMSPRHLHRRCLPLFGYGPRRLARVLRMGRAVAAARAGEPLAQVAADAGYVDQAHLSREVRALAGTSPAGLVRELLSR